jgi:peptidoglycan hydrolase-like protein with peptidoglycan-binding domain
MERKLILCGSILWVACYIGGCATTDTNTSTNTNTEKEVRLQSQVEQLKSKVVSLEAQINSSSQEINNLKDELSNVVKEKKALSAVLVKKKIIGEAESRPSIEQIKVALINAGYQPGVISMKMEKKTFDAVRAFQKANNLAPDGMVGKKTWVVLKKYLYGKPQ